MTLNQHQGFTLLELLVVLAIMTLILAIVPPMLGNVLASSHVKSATRELAAGLKYARSQAINRQEEMTLSLHVDGKYFLVGKKRKQLDVPNDTTMTLITARSEQLSTKEGAIRFFPDGSSTGGQIKIKYASSEYIVDVNWLTGRVRIMP